MIELLEYLLLSKQSVPVLMCSRDGNRQSCMPMRFERIISAI